jgi:hypothetical protein
MTGMNEMNESAANTLCKSCGLCCSGHLFIWGKLRSSELDAAAALGLNVSRDPRQRGFSQPCPLWQGQCTIYHSPHYPRFCRTYKCKLLKEVLDENTSLPDALQLIEEAKGLIHDVEVLLPPSPLTNFHERLVAHLDGQGLSETEFSRTARALLALYAEVFGVDDLIDPPE